ARARISSLAVRILSFEISSMARLRSRPSMQGKLRLDARNKIGRLDLAMHEGFENRIGFGVPMKASDAVVRIAAANNLAPPLDFLRADLSLRLRCRGRACFDR